MPDRKDRVEREIEEIFRKIDDFPTEAARIRARRERSMRGPSILGLMLARLSQVTQQQLMLAGITIVLVSYFIVDRFAPAVSKYGIIIGLLLFFATFLLSLRPVGTPRHQQKRWRGRLIELDDDDEDWQSRARNWWSRR